MPTVAKVEAAYRTCPVCGRADAEPYDHSYRGDWFALLVECPRCGSTWEAEFTFNGEIDDVSPGDGAAVQQ